MFSKIFDIKRKQMRLIVFLTFYKQTTQQVMCPVKCRSSLTSSYSLQTEWLFANFPEEVIVRNLRSECQRRRKRLGKCYKPIHSQAFLKRHFRLELHEERGTALVHAGCCTFSLQAGSGRESTAGVHHCLQPFYSFPTFFSNLLASIHVSQHLHEICVLKS